MIIGKITDHQEGVGPREGCLNLLKRMSVCMSDLSNMYEGGGGGGGRLGRNTPPRAFIHASSCPQKESEKEKEKKNVPPARVKIKVYIHLESKSLSFVEMGEERM